MSRTRGGRRWGASRDEVSAPGERREYERGDIQGASSAPGISVQSLLRGEGGGRAWTAAGSCWVSRLGQVPKVSGL